MASSGNRYRKCGWGIPKLDRVAGWQQVCAPTFERAGRSIAVYLVSHVRAAACGSDWVPNGIVAADEQAVKGSGRWRELV
jgi:hypothetical protein